MAINGRSLGSVAERRRCVVSYNMPLATNWLFASDAKGDECHRTTGPSDTEPSSAWILHVNGIRVPTYVL